MAVVVVGRWGESWWHWDSTTARKSLSYTTTVVLERTWTDWVHMDWRRDTPQITIYGIMNVIDNDSN